MNDNRPVNLDLSTFSFPITAIVSILTRISGVFLFVATAVMLWLLDLSLSGEAGFERARALLATPVAKLVIWAILAGAILHTLAGLKHLANDLGYAESWRGGVIGSRLVLVFSVVLAALAGYWIW